MGRPWHFGVLTQNVVNALSLGQGRSSPEEQFHRSQRQGWQHSCHSLGRLLPQPWSPWALRERTLKHCKTRCTGRNCSASAWLAPPPGKIKQPPRPAETGSLCPFFGDFVSEGLVETTLVGSIFADFQIRFRFSVVCVVDFTPEGYRNNLPHDAYLHK